ncbi:hypothetical protein Bpfe_030382, partial [Biomphalaria pfeifferi]
EAGMRERRGRGACLCSCGGRRNEWERYARCVHTLQKPNHNPERCQMCLTDQNGHWSDVDLVKTHLWLFNICVTSAYCCNRNSAEFKYKAET